MVTWSAEQLDRFKKKKKGNEIIIPTERQIADLYKRVGLSPSEAIFIPSEVPSAKNSKAIACKTIPRQKAKWRHLNSRTGHWDYVVPFIIDSELAQKYRKVIGMFYAKESFRFKQMSRDQKKPVQVEFIFVRRTKGRWDFNNLTEVVQDLMVENGWIDDDNVAELLPFPPARPNKSYYVDKEIQGVFIRVF